MSSPFDILNAAVVNAFPSVIQWVPASQPNTPIVITGVLDNARPDDPNANGVYMLLSINPNTAISGGPLPFPVTQSDRFILSDGSVYAIAQRENDVTGFITLLIHVRNRRP